MRNFGKLLGRRSNIPQQYILTLMLIQDRKDIL